MGATVLVDRTLFGRIEKELLAFGFIARAPAVKKGMRAACLIPAKRTREKLRGLPAYRRNKKGKAHLGDSIGVKVYQAEDGRIVGRVTWKRPGGSHGVPVEIGHRIVRGGTLKKKKTNRHRDPSRTGKGVHVGNVPGKFYLADSWTETQQAQMSALEAGVAKALAGKT